MKHVILGCGDVGRRIAQQLIHAGVKKRDISGYVNKTLSQTQALGIDAQSLDLDGHVADMTACENAQCYYTIAPQKHGLQDQRTRILIDALKAQAIRFKRLVLISTTGVYGDCNGELVTENSPINAQTERGQRRLDSESQWMSWGEQQNVDVLVLRVPGIYAHSRLPRSRIEKAVPVVKAAECGFTNRIHADDLAHACIQAMQLGVAGEVYNVSDGHPGKISEYLQAAAQVLALPKLPEISMSEAQSLLSTGMLSYLSESRKISNQKMLDHLQVRLRYPDFREGIKHG